MKKYIPHILGAIFVLVIIVDRQYERDSVELAKQCEYVH